MSIDRHANSKARQQQRREDAIDRQAEAAKLSPQQKLERLDSLFGEGKGATKERLKLHERISRGSKATIVTHGPTIMAEPSEPKKQRRKRRDEKRGS